MCAHIMTTIMSGHRRSSRNTESIPAHTASVTPATIMIPYAGYLRLFMPTSLLHTTRPSRHPPTLAGQLSREQSTKSRTARDVAQPLKAQGPPLRVLG